MIRQTITCPTCKGNRWSSLGEMCDTCYGVGKIPIEPLRDSILPVVIAICAFALGIVLLAAYFTAKAHGH